MPNWLSTAAMRRSACIAIARPPPRQKPRMRAIDRLGGRRPSLSRPALVARSYSSCASAFGAVLLELADIRARNERLVPGPGQHHHADRCDRPRTRRGSRPARPHLHRHGVALFRLVEGDQADAVILRRQHLAAGVFAGLRMSGAFRSLPSCACPASSASV